MKRVLITGGSRGIGRSIAELFASNGYSVAFTYKNSDDAARELAGRIGAIAIKADSECDSDISKAVAIAERELGGIDILVNNAAVSSYGLLQDISLEEWNRVMSVSVTGAFLYSKLLLPGMIKRGFGRIINITSMWGIVGASTEVHYSAAKAALIGFTKALAKEVGPSGITVNAVAPGVIATDMNKNLSEEDMECLKDETPVGRIGLPEDVAEAVLFLASEKSSVVTGEVMNVSGGFIV